MIELKSPPICLIAVAQEKSRVVIRLNLNGAPDECDAAKIANAMIVAPEMYSWIKTTVKSAKMWLALSDLDEAQNQAMQIVIDTGEDLLKKARGE